jgi:two-component system, OmpR family, sensor kinase
MLAAFGIAIYELQDANRFRQIDAELQTRVAALSRIIREVYRNEPPPPRDYERQRKPPPPRNGWRRGSIPPPAPPEHPMGFRRPPPDAPLRAADRLPEGLSITPETSALFGPASEYYFLIWSQNGAVLRRSENAPRDSPEPKLSERDTLPHLRTRGVYRELIHCSGLGDCVMAGRPVAGELSSAASLGWLLLATGGAVLVIGIGVGSWLTSRAIRPVEEIGATAAHISEGRLSARVRVAGPENELGRLATVLNATFDRLETAFKRQQQFTSDAAHELRTPLTIMISEAQTALARPRTAEEYKQTVEDCLDTAQQMRKLTETLLDLARLDNVGQHRERSEIDLAGAASFCIERLQPLASQNGVQIVPELWLAPVSGVRERIDLVIMNLLINAISYNRRGGEVVVTTRSEGGSCILCVSDTGIGISRDDLPFIFDRFYRADKARSREQGHAGLGLALCKRIVDDEGWTIQVESELGNGTVFTVKIPAKRAGARQSFKRRTA